MTQGTYDNCIAKFKSIKINGFMFYTKVIIYIQFFPKKLQI